MSSGTENKDGWDILRDCIVYAIVKEPKVTKDKIKRNPADMKQWLLENNLDYDGFISLNDKERKKKLQIICETGGGPALKISKSFGKIFKDKTYNDLKDDINGEIPKWFKLYDDSNDDVLIDMEPEVKSDNNNDNNNDDIKVDIDANKDILAKCIVSIIKHARYMDTSADRKADSFTALSDDEIRDNVLKYVGINDVNELQLKDKKEQKNFFKIVLSIKQGTSARVWKYFHQNFDGMNSDQILTKYNTDCKPINNDNNNNNNNNDMDYDDDMKDDIKYNDPQSRVNFEHQKDYETFANDASKTLVKVGKVYLQFLADAMDTNRISGEMLVNEAQNENTFINWYENNIRKKGRTNKNFIPLFREYILKNENIVRDLKYSDNSDNKYLTFMSKALEMIVRDKVLSLKKDTEYMYNHAEYKEFADVFVEDCGLPEGIAIKLTCTMRAEQD